MSAALNVAGSVLLLAGTVFFCAGTLGLLRFPDTLSRMHALTKADNVGLGLLVAGLSLHAADAATAASLLLVWLLVMFSGATAAHLLAARIVEEAGHGP